MFLTHIKVEIDNEIMAEEKTESCSYKSNVALCESSLTAKQRGCSAKGAVI